MKAAKGSGKVYGDFTVAVRDQKKETHFYPVRCFGKLAESVVYIKKGTKLFVEGKLDLNAFTGEDGKKQVMFRVLADTYRILDGGRREKDGEAGGEK
jgi:single-stranded DNA-binding protein